MARVLYGVPIDELKGSIGGVTFHQNSSGSIAKLKPNQPFKNSSKQIISHIVFSEVRSAWSLITHVQQGLWNTFAGLHTKNNYFTENKTLTGYNWFMSINSNRLACGQPIIDEPPEYFVPQIPNAFTLTVINGSLLLSFNSAYDYEDEYLFVFATTPLRGASLFDRRNLRLIGVISPGTEQELDLTDAYIAAFYLDSVPISPDSSAHILVSLAAVSDVSFIASSYSTSSLSLQPALTFSIGTGFSGEVTKIIVQPDDKILVCGLLTTYKGSPVSSLIRLLPNGDLDASFNNNNAFNGEVYDMSLISDGRIICVGFFTEINESSYSHIALFTSSGVIDETFISGSGFDSDAYCVARSPSDRIFVGGNFTDYNGTSVSNIICITASGSVDAGFSSGSGFNNTVWRITVQDEDYLFCGGSFTLYDGDDALRAIKLYSDGSWDDSFDTSSGFDLDVYGITCLPSGKVLLTGVFTSYASTSCNNIVQLTELGAIDSTFSYGTGFDALSYRSILAPSGIYYISGYFDTYKGASMTKFLPVNSLGSVDPLFVDPLTINFITYTIAVDSTGKLYIGGDFTLVNGSSFNRIIRVLSTGAIDTISTP